MRPATTSVPIEVPANLNSTFSRKSVSASGNGCNDILNATVVFEETHTQLSQVELNATFQIENGSPGVEAFSPPDNNNVYHLNTTFPSQLQSNRNSLGSTVINKCALNTTFRSEADPHLDNPTLTFDCDGDDEDQLLEEAIFRKPLLPGAVPKRGLIRTSTLNNEAATLTPSKKDRSPMQGFGLKDIEKAARLQEESKWLLKCCHSWNAFCESLWVNQWSPLIFFRGISFYEHSGCWLLTALSFCTFQRSGPDVYTDGAT